MTAFRAACRPIESIAKRASFWAAIGALVIVFIFTIISVIEERHSNYESEKRRVGTLAGSVARGLAAETLVGDSRSIQVMLSDFTSRFSLTEAIITNQPYEPTPTWWNSVAAPSTVVWSEKLPGVSPARWVVISVKVQSVSGNFSGLSSVIWICLPLLFFGWLMTLQIQKDLYRSIVAPIQELSRNPETWTPDSPSMAREIVLLHEHLLKFISERDVERDTAEKLRIEASIGEVAAQVAHDIRSPLAALDMVAAHLEQIPEEKRIIIRTAISRIRDIANGLLEKHRRPQEHLPSLGNPTLGLDRSHGGAGSEDSDGVELLSSLIDSLITEKRLQYRSRWGVSIEAPISIQGYGLFARVNGSDFKRVLSNLINNAVEAVGEKGRVRVDVSAADNLIKMQVSDDGAGIPEMLIPKLMQKGETFGKQGGVGLGLYSARKKAEEWGGKLEIIAPESGGTVVVLTIPMAATPQWFVPRLWLTEGSQVVVLDDDTTIHQIWDGRFESLQLRSKGIELVHLSTAVEFIRYVLESRASMQTSVYLVDYELIGSTKTGLDLIEELSIASQSVLVTSRFEEGDIRRRASNLKVKMVPKSLAGFVPIQVLAAKSETSDLYGQSTSSTT